MQAAVRLILDEGLPNRFRRHAVAGRAFRAGLDALRLELFPDPSIASNTVSCFKVPNGVEAGAVVKQMRDRYGILIGTWLDRFRSRDRKSTRLNSSHSSI